MFAVNLYVLLYLMLRYVLVSHCDRRIHGGVPVTSNQSYVVYLVKADLSGKNYDFWLCGGALVTVDFIITSAACVEDVSYLYAVAGYNKLVEDPRNHASDPCISKKRKKVIFTCVPVSYQLDYDLLEKWAYIDIALVKVESPYDLEDTSYLEHCSYIPTIIPINYDAKYQNAGMDAMVLGWGHLKSWRTHGNTKNYNKEYLHYAPTLIMDKAECMQEYSIYPNMSQLIDNYMICTLEKGNIDENGEAIMLSEPTASGCSTQQKLLGLKDCEDDDHIDDTRRASPKNKTSDNYNYTMRDFKNQGPTRKNGICQNDHGGPLVTWVGTSMILIGIASVFKVTERNRCIGPFLYTSTQCNGAFLDCILTSEELAKKDRRRGTELCDSPPSVKGFNTIERKISWKDHPAGPAENELKEQRDSMERNSYFAGQEKYPAAKRQPTNEKFMVNDRYTENMNYPVNTNDKYVENNRYKEHINIESDKYTKNLNYPVNTNLNYPVNTNNKYAENNRYKENTNIESDRYTKNVNYPVNANDNIARIGNNKNEQLFIRPQRPLRV